MAKEVLKWDSADWSEIPKQDNPAFAWQGDDYNMEREKECILVMRVLPYEQKAVGKTGYVVIEVPFNGDVIRRGLFWDYEYACKFAECIA